MPPSEHEALVARIIIETALDVHDQNGASWVGHWSWIAARDIQSKIVEPLQAESSRLRGLLGEVTPIIADELKSMLSNYTTRDTEEIDVPISTYNHIIKLHALLLKLSPSGGDIVSQGAETSLADGSVEAAPAALRWKGRAVSALLPCPFCGGEALIWPQVRGTAVVGCAASSLNCPPQPHVYGNEADAIAAWNMRAPPPENSAPGPYIAEGDHAARLAPGDDK